MIKPSSIITPEIFNAIEVGKTFVSGKISNNKIHVPEFTENCDLLYLLIKESEYSWCICVGAWIDNKETPEFVEILDVRTVKKMIIAHEYVYDKYKYRPDGSHRCKYCHAFTKQKDEECWNYPANKN